PIVRPPRRRARRSRPSVTAGGPVLSRCRSLGGLRVGPHAQGGQFPGLVYPLGRASSPEQNRSHTCVVLSLTGEPGGGYFRVRLPLTLQSNMRSAASRGHAEPIKGAFVLQCRQSVGATKHPFHIPRRFFSASLWAAKKRPFA